MRQKVKSAIWKITLVISGCVTAVLGLPAILGIFAIVFKEGNKPEFEASIGLAILATTLGGFILLFSSNRGEHVYLDGSLEKWQTYSIKYLGRLFLLAAFCFALMAFLSPMFPTKNEDLAYLEIAVKYASIISYFVGSASITVGVLLGIFQVFLW